MDKKRTVLLVDDDADVRESLQRLLERQGYIVRTAENGLEGLKMLQAEPSQIVVCDHDMPGMDGVQFLEMVSTRFPSVIRILLTGRQDAQTSLRAINVGHVWRFLQKPCRASELLTVLHFAGEAAEADAENRRLLAMVRTQQRLLQRIERTCPSCAAEIVSQSGA